MYHMLVIRSRLEYMSAKQCHPYFCCWEAGPPNAPPPKIDGLVVVLLDKVPAAAVLLNADDPKGDDCGVVVVVVVVVVVAGVCPNENANPPDPETGVPFVLVKVVAAGVPLVGLFTPNENLGGVIVVLLPVLPLGGALLVEVDVDEAPFPNTTLLGASVELLLPNALPPNIFEVWICCIPKGDGLVPVLFENAVVVFVLPPPNTDF